MVIERHQMDGKYNSLEVGTHVFGHYCRSAKERRSAIY